MRNKILNIMIYGFSSIAGIVFILAIWNKFLMLFGWRISILQMESSRMLEISAILVVYVIAFMLKKIGNELKAR